MALSALRAAALPCALFATICITPAASAQTGPNPPPRQDTRSPTGISYHSGAFSHQERDLAIGAGDFPAGLTLERSYLSNMDPGLSAYSGVRTQGWNTNLDARVGNTIIENQFQQPPGGEDYLYSVTTGGGSVGFLGGSTNPTGGFEGTYERVSPGGEALVFTGEHSTGTFTFTAADGTVFQFHPLNAFTAALRVSSQTAPDGTRLDYAYDGDGLRSVISSRGYALLFEFGSVAGGRAWVKACAVNMAVHYVTALSVCPAGVQTVTYGYAAGASTPTLAAATDATGRVTTYGYSSRGHLDCITRPGQSSCEIQNSYATCVRWVELEHDPDGLALHDPVRSQVTATGETYTTSVPETLECPVRPGAGGGLTVTAGSIAPTAVATNVAGMPTAVTDPLNRARSIEYWPWFNVIQEETLVSTVTEPEGNQLRYEYDGRGNLTLQRLRAVSGSNLPDLDATAEYPVVCSNRKICNRPLARTDANSNRADFTYSPDHGGILSETLPAAPNDVRPQTRYEYVQRHAWVKDASGSFVQSAGPMWLLAATSSCRTSSATGNPAAPCATPGDEVRTIYDYGPDSGPNNLLLRGQAATADGVTLRTCYGYDQSGRRISETQPNANLSSCQ